MREPEEFDHTKGKAAKRWFTKACYWVNMQLPNYRNNEEAMVMRLLTLMKQGKAVDWAQPHLEGLASHHPEVITTL